MNISIEKGKLVALLGKNGIGKSTLLRTISQVQQPISGAIYINQKNSCQYSNKELAKSISLVLTEALPESQLTVFEVIALGRQPYTNWIDQLSKNDLHHIHWAIEETSIGQLKSNYFHELSDGQKQRVLIAKALAQDTEIIILDEPTVHLDLHHTLQIFELLKKLVKTTQKTILISTHEANLALSFADDFIVLTEYTSYYGSLKALSNQHVFETLFSSESIRFDQKLQQFLIQKK